MFMAKSSALKRSPTMSAAREELPLAPAQGASPPVAASADATDTAEGAGQRIAPTRAIARKKPATFAAGTCVGRGRRLMEGRLRRVPITPCVVGSPLDSSTRPCKIRGPISRLHPEAPFPGSDACGQRCCQEHDVLQGQDPTFRCGLQLL